jgi:hydrogenase small subunit
MDVSRREFIRYCSFAAASIGISQTQIGLLSQAMANPAAPGVIWLHGSGCTGCSVSFLNRISATSPRTAGDVLISSINLLYHPTLMSAAGETAARVAMDAYRQGGYVLVVEGAVPTLYNGATCFAWTLDGIDIPILEAVYDLGQRAAKVVCVGNCSSFGGVPATGPNVTGIQSVRNVTGKATVNIAGCPPHPDWIVWAIVQILTNAPIAVDSNGRPTAIYGKKLHDNCPRKEREKAKSYGIDNLCLKEIGCRGPDTRCNCQSVKWNNAVNWCIDGNTPCIACTEPQFPFSPVLKAGESSHDD